MRNAILSKSERKAIVLFLAFHYFPSFLCFLLPRLQVWCHSRILIYTENLTAGPLFKLRGLTRDEILEKISGTKVLEEMPPLSNSDITELLSNDITQYWHGDQKSFTNIDLNINTYSPITSLPDLLGPLPFWKCDLPFIESIKPIYKNASKRAINILAKELNSE